MIPIRIMLVLYAMQCWFCAVQNAGYHCVVLHWEGVKTAELWIWCKGQERAHDHLHAVSRILGREIIVAGGCQSIQNLWEKVFSSVEYIVAWGLDQWSLDNISAIGVDEVAWQKGHRYLTVVYQIDRNNTRLLWIGQNRTEQTISRLLWFSRTRTESAVKIRLLGHVETYVKVIAEMANQALHILDRFHIVAMLNKAIDEIRASEQKQLIDDGYEPVLKKLRWCLLKRKKT